MNTRERKEALELASHLRGIAKGKEAHAEYLRGSAKSNRWRSKLVPSWGELFDPSESLSEYPSRAEVEQLKADAESYEAEAEEAEAAAAAAYAEADRLTERAIRGG